MAKIASKKAVQKAPRRAARKALPKPSRGLAGTSKLQGTVRIRDLYNDGAEYELPRQLGRKYHVKGEGDNKGAKYVSLDVPIIITETNTTTQITGTTETVTKVTKEIARMPQDLFRKIYDVGKAGYVNDYEKYELNEDAFPPYFDIL